MAAGPFPFGSITTARVGGDDPLRGHNGFLLDRGS